MRRLAFLLLIALTFAGRLPAAAGTGPAPTLPAPKKKLIPTVVVARATGWPQGRVPAAANGRQVTALASDLDHPRWLYVLPNGDVLVAESNAPPKKPEPGIKAFFFRLFMKRAGGAVPSANRITLLRDADGDGVAETRTAFLQGGSDLVPDYKHGSWNRRPRSGYKVIFVPFSGGMPSGPPQDFLTGFLSEDGEAYGRPVGVAIARDGAVLVADDVGNVIWRVK